jgi:hypothetical protein
MGFVQGLNLRSFDFSLQRERVEVKKDSVLGVMVSQQSVSQCHTFVLLLQERTI